MKCLYCDNEAVVKSRQLCKKHYIRVLNYGDPNVIKREQSNGNSQDPAYRCWQNMKARCYYEGYYNYSRYGGRGIKVCDRWLEVPNGFKNFKEDMGERPSQYHSIERIDTNGDYTPENCRWATSWEQSNNKTNNTAHPGVYLQTNGKWLAQFTIRGKKFSELFDTLEEAQEYRTTTANELVFNTAYANM